MQQRRHFLLAFPLALALHAAPGGAGDEPASLEEARQFFESRELGEVERAARWCAAEGSAAATALLLEILAWEERPDRAIARSHFPELARSMGWGGRPVHREIAYGALREAGSAAARAAVAAELAGDQGNARVREACAELLGRWGAREHAEVLRGALDDPELGVRRAAVRSLAALEDAESAPALEALATHRDATLRGEALLALARLAPERAQEVQERGLADEDGRVRCATLGALACERPEAAAARAAELLADPDWRVRTRALAAVQERPSVAGVDGLVAMLGDERPQLALGALELLQAWTGRKLTQPREWRGWWELARGGFEFPAARQEPARLAREHARASVGQLALTSGNLAFAVDRSLAGRRALEDGLPIAEASYQELERLLADLAAAPGRTLGEVWTFSEGAEPYEPAPVRLGEASRQEALAFVRRNEIGGVQNPWKLFQALYERSSADTLLLFWSGSAPEVERAPLDQLVELVERQARFHPLTVHVLAFGAGESELAELERLAAATGGRCLALR